MLQRKAACSKAESILPTESVVGAERERCHPRGVLPGSGGWGFNPCPGGGTETPWCTDKHRTIPITVFQLPVNARSGYRPLGTYASQ